MFLSGTCGGTSVNNFLLLKVTCKPNLFVFICAVLLVTVHDVLASQLEYQHNILFCVVIVVTHTGKVENCIARRIGESSDTF